MDYRTTSAAGLASSRGFPWIGKAAFAVAMVVVAAGLAAWVAGFDIAAWLRNQEGAKAASLSSFDDRFGSGSARNAPSIRYPSRPAPRSGRREFDAEFGHIENQLADQSPDMQPGQSRTTAEGVIPLPRSWPPEASLAMRVDPSSSRSDDRTMFQKLADMVPMRFTLAALTPGCSAEDRISERSVTIVSPPSTTSRHGPSTCRTASDSRPIPALAA